MTLRRRPAAVSNLPETSPMLFLLLAACGTPKSADSSATDTAAGDAPTWADVAPVVERSCVGCHHEGGVGTGDFTTYASAAPMAAAIAAYVEGGVMPPPAMDPECRSYVGHERMVLSDADKALLADWAAGGALEGDPIAALTWSPPVLEGADTEIALPVAHGFEPGATGNEYHCQILENPFTETTFVTGFDVLVDQPGIVHHTVLAIDYGGDAGTRSGDPDLSDGWDCETPITEADWGILHAWAPGMEPTAFSDGLGLRVEPGDQIVLQMHYFGEEPDAGTLDQSGYRLRTAESVTTELYMSPVGPTDFVLPAGQVSEPVEELVNDYGIDITIHGVFPHMHLLATGYSSVLSAGSADETCLARADAWDFGHQATYLYDEPAIWADGTTLTSTCTFDNTVDNPNQYNDPPVDVTFGEGTNQEMCFFLYYYSI